MAINPEFWLRGPVTGVPISVQPIAHALLQADAEIAEALANFSDIHLWETPAGVASVGFHLQHLRGVLDRLFTYAADQQLSALQLEALKKEGVPYEHNDSVRSLLTALHDQVKKSIDRLRNIDESQLKDPRGVGRAKLPSTVGGLLFHAAEHTMRHTGQLLVTIKVIQSGSCEPNVQGY